MLPSPRVFYWIAGLHGSLASASLPSLYAPSWDPSLPKIENKRSIELFAISKASLCLVVGVLRGHCPIYVHALKLKIRPNTQVCESKLKHLGAHSLRYPTELVGVEIKHLCQFILVTGASRTYEIEHRNSIFIGFTKDSGSLIQLNLTSPYEAVVLVDLL